MDETTDNLTEAGGSFSSRADKSRAELLDGITILPQLGIPGRVVVYGDDATPVLCGDRKEDVLVACAELGKGRIIALSHDGYLLDIVGAFKEKSVARFQMNMKQWVSHQTYVDDSEVFMLRSKESVNEIQGCKIAVWSGGACELTHEVVEFVMGGGGLLCGMIPWGWLKMNEGKSMSEMPLYSVLQLVGICYTPGQMENNKDGFDTSRARQKNGGLHICDVKDQAELQALLPESGLLLPDLERQKHGNRKWRQEILNGISVLPRLGFPGKIAVYGDHASPILSGVNSEDIIIACAAFGKGRIVVLSHDRYVNFMFGNAPRELAKLHLNMKNWVSNYTYRDRSQMCLWRARRDLELKPGCKIVISRSPKGQIKDEKNMQALEDFVQGGGGLIVGTCPWAWVQVNRGMTVPNMPVFRIMDKAGMCYTTESLRGNNKGFNASESLAGPSGGLHIGQALHEALDPTELAKNGEKVTALIRRSPGGIIKTQQSKFEKLREAYAAELERCGPTPKHPAVNARQKALLGVCELLLLHDFGMTKAPGIESFPGDFAFMPPLQSVELEFEARHPDFHSTGFYLPAGVQMKVTGVDGVQGWKVRVGAHTDRLYKKDKLTRWPNIHLIRNVRINQVVSLVSPFGGLVYLISPSQGGKIKVQMEGVVEAPLFDLRDPQSKKYWEERRQSPGLWADIAGKYITITVPSESVRDLDAPWEVMETWDRVVLAHNELRGTHPSDHRREFVVCDLQPSAGYMHAGHPIVTQMDVATPSKDGGEKFLLDDSIMVRHWGLFHELGHNVQRKEWTFAGTGEVTCNIFTLHARDVVCGLNAWDDWLPRARTKIRTYFKAGAPRAQWKSIPGVALAVYVQLEHHFGWESYKIVFRTYEDMDPKEAPQADQQKIDTWISTFSKAVEINLCPLFEFWGIPFSDKVRGELSGMTPWLPDDEITRMAPDRAQSTRERYPGIVSQLNSDSGQEQCVQWQDSVEAPSGQEQCTGELSQEDAKLEDEQLPETDLSEETNAEYDTCGK